ncbi:MAG: phospho-N-acetylmuramoyl-pentapeptide-transferase [Flavobacteriales bacterium]|nr:phospho-N-acetylmuramoyl-pentapeptide-transferase [Flavobacteriales bacterium]
MLYHLFEYLENAFDTPGAGLFQYISFRSGASVMIALVISMLLGNKLIGLLRKKQIGESIRDLGLKGQNEKAGTPTMGGLIILGAILIPVLLLADLTNFYVIILLFTTVFLGVIGFIDDYIKVFKKNKKGLAGKFKIVGQVGVGLIVGAALFFHPDFTMKEKVPVTPAEIALDTDGDGYIWKEQKSTKTTLPFIKNNEFDYANILFFLKEKADENAWIVFIPMVIFVVTFVSNGANMTDGLDGLATGVSAIIGIALAIFAYVSGNTIFADYLDIMYLPNAGETVVFVSAFVGACIGFLWHNAYPAKVFMGDTGSLALGGIIAVFAIIIRKELLIPIICGIFLIENFSVMAQVAYFKYTKKKFGEGKRIFKMAPLHHHYQVLGMHESKIVARFWIIGVMLAVISIVTLKIR